MDTIKVLFSGRELRQRRRETVLNPPRGVSYQTLVDLKQMRPDFVISKNQHQKHFKLNELGNKIYSFFGIPNIQYISSKYLKDIDLVHTPGHMLLNRIPYVVEIDNPACLARYDLLILLKRKKIIESFLTSKYCVGIICLSEAAKNGMEKYFSSKVADKLVVIYPFVKINPYVKQQTQDKIIILTVNTKFYMKGTGDLLLAYQKLRQKYNNLELWVISNTPKEFLEKYKDYEGIKFFPAKFNKEELYRDFYSQCDIFVQASYQDSFGLVYLELMASGKPIVTTDIYAIPELVIDGENGFLIKSPVYMYNEDFTLKPEYFPMRFKDTEEEFYKKINGSKVVEDLVEKMDRLVSSEELRKKMGQKALDLINTKFSEHIRQEKLLKIYGRIYENN